MREALKNAVHNAILLEYKLPHKVSGLDLDKSCLSSQNDICFSNSNPQEISKIIYMHIGLTQQNTKSCAEVRNIGH